MSRKTNADRMFDSYYEDFWYYRKDDSIRLNEDFIITDNHTSIGIMVNGDYNELVDDYSNYILLTMQDFKSQRTWKTHRLQIAKSAINRGLPVIYVPEIDIGFGINVLSSYDNNLNDLYDKLLSLAIQHKTDQIGAIIKYNADVMNIWAAPEQELEYKDVDKPIDILKHILTPDESDLTYVSLVEPTTREINALIDVGVRRIYFAIPLKDTTLYHIDLVNSILNRSRKDNQGLPIKYRCFKHSKILKWHERRNKQ